MDHPRPRALVLSAGGMFGAYQAGVWAEIADCFDPEIVVGASVGSLNAWQIACGCPPHELVERWQRLDTLASIRWRIPRHLFDGLLDNSALEGEIRSMCSAAQPVRRLGVVLTRTRTLQPALFEWPDLNWTHIAASCAVPLFLRSYRIGNHWYSDGGVMDPLPLAGALAMGARTVVAVNVMKHRPGIVCAAVDVLRRWTRYSPPDTRNVAVLEISPQSPLGTMRDSMYWSRDNTSRLIELGRRDAREKKAAIVQWCDREIPALGNVPNPSAA